MRKFKLKNRDHVFNGLNNSKFVNGGVYYMSDYKKSYGYDVYSKTNFVFGFGESSYQSFIGNCIETMNISLYEKIKINYLHVRSIIDSKILNLKRFLGILPKIKIKNK